MTISGAAAALLLPLVAAATVACGVPRDDRPKIRVYAAASLRDVLQEIAPRCERETGSRLLFHFAGSSLLARQIETAGNADVFFSADEDWMDHLAQAGLVVAGSRTSPLSNRLVVVVPPGRTPALASATDLADGSIGRIAVANPDAVPAGKYAKAWLRSTGEWDRLRRRIVPTLDVRAALAAVETGVVDAGIVYATDAGSTTRARIAFAVPVEEAPVITYAVAALEASETPRLSGGVVDCLTDADSKAAFVRHGFIVRESDP